MLFTDQTGRTIELQQLPRRIISLVPSQTELLSFLGLGQEVAGITKFCVHPEDWFRNKPRVGGTKQLHTGIIDQLQPDLIIANKEENVKEQVEALAARYPVWISDVNTLQDSYEMILAIGAMTGKEQEALSLIHSIKNEFETLISPARPPRTAYLIWRDPYMTVGGDTFIHTMMKEAGFDNMYADTKRYPEITIDELKQAGCDVLLLSSEPFPFQQQHIDELQPMLPGTKIILADGEMFSWYGSRLLQAPDYFKRLTSAHGIFE